MIEELLAFVTARLADDMATALAASPGPWHLNAERTEVIAADEEIVAEAFALGSNQLRATAEHIARHDPAYVLSDVAFRRRLLDEYIAAELADDALTIGGVPGELLRAFAAVWSDHADYQESWRP